MEGTHGILISLVLLLLICGVASNTLAAHPAATQEQFNSSLHLSGPTKCFSCERAFPPAYSWLGRQTKCFDCERQLAREDPNLANKTHGTKCFSCERPVVVRSTNNKQAVEDDDVPPQAVHHRSTAMQPFRAENAQACMDAGSGQCFF